MRPGKGLWLALCTLLIGFWAGARPVQQSGVASGDAAAPVLDEQNRPITAGGLVQEGPRVYEDVTAASGLAGFQHRSGSALKRYILEVPSGGVALFDYDSDGWLDIYLVNGSTLEALRSQAPHPRAALFRNNRDGTFSDVTERAGVANLAWGFGAAVGDYNRDGRPDLYVCNFGPNRLYRNNGDGTFTDVAGEAGVALGDWSTAASFGDYNGDGRLDLFVTGYVEFDPNSPPEPDNPEVGLTFCQYRGQAVMCGPRGLKGKGDALFLNQGNGRFQEVSRQAGVDDPNGYYGFAAAWVDFDDDGRLDLVVVNDSTPNALYRNRGDGTFEDIAFPAGFALNEYGREQAGMGLAVGDYDQDGRVDFYVTNFSDDYNTLYRNDGNGFFTDLTFQLGLGDPSIPFLGWGTGFVDFNNDTFADLFVANGHVYAQVDDFDWGTTWAQRPLLFENRGGKRFQPVPPLAGSGLAVIVPARGSALGDLDNDGRVDVVMNCNNAPPRLLRNVFESGHHWVTLQLTGAGRSSPDAVGAKVFLRAGGARQRGDVISGGSYASQNDLRLHFGLGQADRIDQLEIHWPSGAIQKLADLPVDQIIRITEK